jgi:hypothetical protein
MWYQFTDIADEGISEPSLSVVNAYTSLETNKKIYDRVAAYRMTEEGIKLGQIVSRAGPNLVWDTPFSVKIKQDATLVWSKSGDTFTAKASSLSADTFTTHILPPPATLTADTNEVISTEVEDANGDSSVTIQAGAVSTYEIWKISDATPPDNYATGTLLATVNPGKYRFIHADGYKMVIRDQVTSYRVVSEMEKGIYKAEMFFGSQVQLAQSATVEQIYTLNQGMDVDLQAIKGTGFIKDTHSLTTIRDIAAVASTNNQG